MQQFRITSKNTHSHKHNVLKQSLKIITVLSTYIFLSSYLSSSINAQSSTYGKGVIYYTENYLRNYNKYPDSNLPVPDVFIETYQKYYTAAENKCSRYIDMTQRGVDQFKDLGLGHIILGFGPASWYNLAPTRPNDPTDWNDSKYKFATLDTWIGKLQNANITPVLQLWGTPSWAMTPTNVDAAYFGDQIHGFETTTYTFIKGNTSWSQEASTGQWTIKSLDALYRTSSSQFPNDPPVPTDNIDAAYFDKDGVYTVIAGDRYWYRTPATADSPANISIWRTNTLESAYKTSSNYYEISPSVPIGTIDNEDSIDAAYFDSDGAYTVIAGDRYWYRTSEGANWYTNTLASTYEISSSQFPNDSPVPTNSIDAAYFDSAGAYTVIKGDRYWYRTSNTAAWKTDTLVSAYFHTNKKCNENDYKDFEPHNYMPANSQEYADFVTAVTNRYNGANVKNPEGTDKLLVEDIIIWNEPNLTQFWKEGNTYPNRFLTLHQQAYDAIKKARSSVNVWGLSISGNSNDPSGLLDSACDAGLQYDILAYHPYPRDFNQPPANQPDFNYDISKLPELIEKLSSCPLHSTTPIALTEIGYRNNLELSESSGITITPDEKAQYLQETLDIIDDVNLKKDNRIIAVANNTLHNAWRWWFTGLINIFPFQGNDPNPLQEKDPAYIPFKTWEFPAKPTPTNEPPPAQDPDQDGDYDYADYLLLKDTYLNPFQINTFIEHF